MDIALALNRLWRHKLWLIPVGILAVVVALVVLYRVSLVPPQLESKSLTYGTASTQLLVDAPDSLLTDLSTSITALSERAQIYAGLLGSQPVRTDIARRTGERAGSVLITAGSTAESDEPEEAERSLQLARQAEGRQLTYLVSTESPVIQIATQAPTAGEAVGLADQASLALSDYVGQLQESENIEPPERITLRRLEEANGESVTVEVPVPLALASALGVLVLGLLAILAAPTFIRYLRLAATIDHAGREKARAAEVAALHDRSGEHPEDVESRTKAARPA